MTIMYLAVNLSQLSGVFPSRLKRQIPSLPFGIPGLLSNGDGGVTITPAELRALLCVDNGSFVDRFVDFDNVSAVRFSAHTHSHHTPTFILTPYTVLCAG